MPSAASTAELGYDLFLSYNSVDHVVVEGIARRLREEGLEPFLDRWYLTPGTRWRPYLEETLINKAGIRTPNRVKSKLHSPTESSEGTAPQGGGTWSK